MTPKRRKKHPPEQIVAKLRDAFASECQEGPSSGPNCLDKAVETAVGVISQDLFNQVTFDGQLEHHHELSRVAGRDVRGCKGSLPHSHRATPR